MKWNLLIGTILSVLIAADLSLALTAAFSWGAVALAYEKFDEDTRAGAHEEYLDSIEEFRVGDGYEIPGEFVVASGVK